MKAIIIGYGKMGREIEKILAERGHEVVLVVDADNSAELNAANLARADVAIEFTTPATACANIRTCLEHGIPYLHRRFGIEIKLKTSRTGITRIGDYHILFTCKRSNFKCIIWNRSKINVRQLLQS